MHIGAGEGARGANSCGKKGEKHRQEDRQTGVLRWYTKTGRKGNPRVVDTGRELATLEPARRSSLVPFSHCRSGIPLVLFSRRPARTARWVLSVLSPPPLYFHSVHPLAGVTTPLYFPALRAGAPPPGSLPSVISFFLAVPVRSVHLAPRSFALVRSPSRSLERGK